MATKEPMYEYQCPMCNKIRMVRPKGFEFDPDETTTLVTPGGQEIVVPRNRCSWCDDKIVRRHFKPTKDDAKAVLKAMSDKEAIPEDKSLEDLL